MFNYVDVFAEEISNASDENPHSNLNKFKGPMMKLSTKSSFVFKTKQ